jgi:hypothetical protein
MSEQVWRWPAVIVSHPIKDDGPLAELSCRMDVNPKTGKAHGVMLWRTNGPGKGHDIDHALDKIGRKISRVMQGREP